MRDREANGAEVVGQEQGLLAPVVAWGDQQPFSVVPHHRRG